VEEGVPRRARGDGANGGRRRPFPVEGACGTGCSRSGRQEERVRTLWSSREGSRRSWAREGASAVGRSYTASPWHFDGSPRRACQGWRRVAWLNGRGGAGLGNPVGVEGVLAGEGSARPAASASSRRRQGRERGKKERKRWN